MVQIVEMKHPLELVVSKLSALERATQEKMMAAMANGYAVDSPECLFAMEEAGTYERAARIIEDFIANEIKIMGDKCRPQWTKRIHR